MIGLERWQMLIEKLQIYEEMNKKMMMYGANLLH